VVDPTTVTITLRAGLSSSGRHNRSTARGEGDMDRNKAAKNPNFRRRSTNLDKP